MYRVLSCLTGQHDYRLVGLAALVCVLASVLAFHIYRSALSRSGAGRNAFLILAGLCTATGIWTTHFVAMLAYDAGMPMGYDVWLTALSFVIAVCATTAGFLTMGSGRPLAAALGGIVIGLGISGMHFTGMEAVVVAGRLSWDPVLSTAALASGAALTALAALAGASLRGRLGMVAAPLLLTLGICAMHFTAMAAAGFQPDPTIAAPDAHIDELSLAILIVAMTMMLMLAGIIATLASRFTIARGTFGVGSAILAMLGVTIGISFYAVEQVRISGPNYQRIIAGKDLVADILPPPAYIIESYLEAIMALARPERHEQHALRLATLKGEYQARHAHWKASRLIPDDLKTALVEESDELVRYFWIELENEFLPALARQNVSVASASLDRLTGHYLAHRTVIEKIVKMANTFSEDVEKASNRHGGLMERVSMASIAMLLIVIIGAMLALNTLVIGPLLATASHLKAMTSGRYDDKVPYANRTDEIGTMAGAIDTLRLASIEKQRLEAEAAEARRKADEERRVRDKERAAEALRLRLANESITGLNDDLNRAFGQLQKAQDENVRKGKLAQLGQLTATVAHEIRNPLGAVKTAAYLIERKIKDKGLGIEAPMQRINNGIQRCDTIITELLDFTRTKALATTAQPVDEWIQSVIEEERRNISQEVAISLDLGAGKEPAHFDAGRLRRVLINLLSNAAEAMVGKGNDQGIVKTASPRIAITSRLLDGNIEIECKDNGPGISPENLAKIREPLFTTKSFGVGLGIPAIENILEQHGGGLRIESIVGQGATMTAWFPMRANATPTTQQEPRKVA